MSAAPIDLTPLKAAGPLRAFANAFDAGQALAARPVQANAFADPAAPTRPPPNLAPPVASNGGAATAPAPPGDQDAAAIGAALAAMSGPQRLATARQAEKLAAVGVGLRSLAYGERRAVLAHMTPALARNGLDPAAVAGFDPTDEALDAQVASAMGLKAALEAPAAGP